MMELLDNPTGIGLILVLAGSICLVASKLSIAGNIELNLVTPKGRITLLFVAVVASGLVIVLLEWISGFVMGLRCAAA